MARQTKTYYIQLDVEQIGNKYSYQCWLSTAEFWHEDADTRPYEKNHINVAGLWKIRSNRQMTLKEYELVTEYAQRIMIDQNRRNEIRKLSNR
jgi:hypothetical protein